MAKNENSRISIAALGRMQPHSSLTDASLPGFGARRRAGADIVFFAWYRNSDGRPRRATIGILGKPWTLDQARRKGLEILSAAKVEGADPAAEKRERREAPTVAVLCDIYLKDAMAGRLLTRRGVMKKASTLATDKSRIDAHIKPLLGEVKVRALTRQDVEKLRAGITEGKTAKREASGKKRGVSNVRGGKGAAARTMGLLGAILEFGVRNGMRADNPARGVVRPADGRRERRLSAEEYASLGTTLRTLSAPPMPRKDGKPGRAPMWLYAPAAVRFLALTGWRRGEALNLRWSEVDLSNRTARLTDTKTGASVRPLSNAACDLLRELERLTGSTLVFPSSRGGDNPMSGFQSMFDRITKAATLPAEVSAHVLRHSFASVGGDLGYSEATIGALIGHRGGSMTSRYVHHADAVLLAAADKVADEVARQMGDAALEAAVIPLPSLKRRSA
nr:tyrosine-type recombinase/integrase [uncultured Roseococcus sp.]